MRTANLVVMAILLAGCGKHRPSGGGQPAPSSSVITLGIEIGACPDVAACERECDAGSADRCRRLAMTYAFGKGVDKDESKATELLIRACDMGDPSSCVFAGQSYEFEHGVPKDFAKAARFYEKGCDLKWPPGCYNLAIMYERGTGVPKDRKKAGDLYQLACTAGAPQACDKAKEMHAPQTLPFLDGGFP
jgi:TPR repeat protein